MLTRGRISLTDAEYRHAAHAGFERNVENILQGRPDAYGHQAGNGGYDIHTLGAIAELAVARFFDCFWSGPGTLRDYDVGKLQVRSTGHERGKLIVHPQDDDDDVFVLVWISGRSCVIRGWMLGGDAKNPQWWADPSKQSRPAYFVPVDQLRSLAELPRP